MADDDAAFTQRGGQRCGVVQRMAREDEIGDDDVSLEIAAALCTQSWLNLATVIVGFWDSDSLASSAGEEYRSAPLIASRLGVTWTASASACRSASEEGNPKRSFWPLCPASKASRVVSIRSNSVWRIPRL